MGLVKLGSLIELCEEKNTDLKFGLESVKGVSIAKRFIETKADMNDVSLRPYLLIEPDAFAFVPITSRNGEGISLAHNDSDNTYICSSSYVVFRVGKKNRLIPSYLRIFFNRPEFDRYTRFNSWGSAREAFSWDEMCDIPIDLPPFTVQQKYVNVYNAMLANQGTYENGLDDLKLTCDAYIERLRRELPHTAIGEFIELCEDKNTALKFGLESVKGVSIAKRFIETKADMSGVLLGPYLIIEPDAFAFVTVTSRNGERISLAHNDSDDTYICSSSYVVFRVAKKKKLIPSYLRIFFNRSEFDRYTRFHSWGSARETFGWDDMCEVKIPIPALGVQQSIVSIYKAYVTRREANEKLKAQIKNICPILIKGSLEDVIRGVA